MPLESPRAALQDISWRSNVAATPGEFVIPQEDVAVAAQSCRSRRNLAARLATAIFPSHEKAGSNCCGVLGKTALNGLKVKAIYTTSLQHFPLQRLETRTMAEKDMRNAIDKVCRKTKTVAVQRPQENLS